MKTVRTYMNLPTDIDPAHILSMADLELSIALASPLVGFDQERQITAALAEKWEILPPKTIQFKFRKNLLWSDGTPITADQFKASLERARKAHPDDLKALFESIESMTAVDSQTLQLTTTTEIHKSGILLKLTEPMYGLLSTKEVGLDLAKSSGPYSVVKNADGELHLKANPHWYMYKPDMPQEVQIRRPPANVDLIEYFQKDEWANLISGTSLMKNATREGLEKAGIKTWQRSLDKVFSFYPSKRFINTGGAEVLKKLSSALDYQALTENLSGHTRAEQFFPRGYELWSAKSPVSESSGNFKKIFRLKVIIPDTHYTLVLRPTLQKALNQISGISADVEVVPLIKLNERMKLGDYDLLATGIAVADPNFEGAMSFFFERDPAFIPSSKAPTDFADQVRLARGLPTSKDRAAKMRGVMLAAQEAGHVLPLFHFSSVALAKPGVDLSQIPNTDETVLFFKVKMP